MNLKDKLKYKIKDKLDDLKISSGVSMAKAKYDEISERGWEFKVKILRRNALLGWSLVLLISIAMIVRTGWSWWWLLPMIPSAYWIFAHGVKVIGQFLPDNEADKNADEKQ